MPQANYEERKQARIDRLKEKASKSKTISDNLYDSAQKMASAIPFGQPILVGHHSEKRDCNFRNRIHNKFGKAIEEGNKAQSYQEKAEAAESNSSISSDDPEATQKLQAKIEKAEKYQATMKAINKIIKNKKLSQYDKTERIIADYGFKDATVHKLLEPDFCGRVGFPSYELINNNANIRRMKQRIESLKLTETQETKEIEYDNFKIVENANENRIQFIFDGKPDFETRTILKQAGFKWSPYNMAWQRHLNNAGRYATKDVIKLIS